jgi:hypothetical protein
VGLELRKERGKPYGWQLSNTLNNLLFKAAPYRGMD